MRLRHKLVLVFLAATLVPLAAILWASSALMSRSLDFVATGDVTTLANSLERVGREYYRQARQHLRDDAAAGRLSPERLGASCRAAWPASFRQFWDSSDAERFILSEPEGDRLHYAVKRGGELLIYSVDLDGVRMGEITREIRDARTRAGDLRQRNLPRGFTLALLLAAALAWTVSLVLLVYLSIRISRPIQRLTTGLGDLAAGRFDTRLPPGGSDEVGQAVEAFNQTAGELQRSRDRLVYLTRVASWQLLARKMAHELKNSLTPIRLTVEEIAARQSSADDADFFDRAAAIVVSEVTSLERRVRAFSEFAAEPEARPSRLDLDGLVRERVEFLRGSHPGVTYRVEAGSRLAAWADEDQVKGIVTNLLENAADAAGDGGQVLVVMGSSAEHALVEVHDSGPGVSAEARQRLFEPSISFKKHGMGLGLAISRKNALLAGGDLALIDGRLGGAGFGLLIPLPGKGERETEVCP